MNPGRLIEKLKQTLQEHETLYASQEEQTLNGLPAGLEKRWKAAHRYLNKPGNKATIGVHSSCGLALAAAVLTSFLLAEDPNPILHRLIYRYTLIDDNHIFQHNLGWLLLAELVSFCESDPYLIPLQPDTDIPIPELLRDLLTLLRQDVFGELYQTLQSTPVPRHL